MTDKELQKLGRRELLQLLLEQAKETERLGKALAETEAQLHELEETYERLRGRLDRKDVQMHEQKEALEAQMHELEETNVRLRGRLDYKDAQIAELRAEREQWSVELSQAGSIAEAALKLNGVFEAAQRAADQYLKSVQALYPLPEGVELPAAGEEPVVEILPEEAAQAAEVAEIAAEPAVEAAEQKAPAPLEVIDLKAVEPEEPSKKGAKARKPGAFQRVEKPAEPVRQQEKGAVTPKKPPKVEKGKWTLFFGVEKV